MPSPITTAAPMTAARSTLGCGRASTTNATIVTSPSAGIAYARAPSHLAAVSTTASTIVTFAPLTAVRCVSPLVWASTTRSAGMRRSSPTTTAGTRPRGSGASPFTADRRPARTSPASRWARSGSSTTTGGTVALKVATSRPTRAVGPRRPVTCTTVDGRSSLHPDPVAMTTTGLLVVHSSPRARMRTTTAGITSIGEAPGRPALRTARASPEILRSTLATARSAARSGTGPSDAVASPYAATAATAAAPSRPTAQNTAALRRGEEPPARPTPIPRPIAPRIARPPTTPGRAASGTTGIPKPASHAPAAAAASRRSAGR